MKTMITVLLLVAATAMNAQTMTLTAVSPNRACPGDTLKVSFKFDGTPGIYQFNMACSSLNKIWSKNSNVFYGLPKAVVNGDTIYTIKLATDNFWPNVVSMVTLDWVSGFSVDFNCGTNLTGLPSLNSLGDPANNLPGDRVKYYDFMGNEVEPKSGEILIKRVNGLTKKVLYHD